jgi:glycine/D-amino acid oxidase-like deaminating enzyme
LVCRVPSITDGQAKVFEPIDYMALIGKNSGHGRIYVGTWDSGNGLTHGVIAGKLVSDLVLGKENARTQVYDPKRKATLAQTLPSMIAHDDPNQRPVQALPAE